MTGAPPTAVDEGWDSGPVAALPTVTTLLQTVEIPATPEEVFDAYLDAARHAEFTGSPAEISGAAGSAFTAWDGSIRGTTVEVDAGRRVVQAWRTSEWPEGYEDSRLELTFVASPAGGTKLTMVHSGVPAAQAKQLEQGWMEFYWEPLRRYFSNDSGD
jgi:activator of HSP90 ATPase